MSICTVATEVTLRPRVRKECARPWFQVDASLGRTKLPRRSIHASIYYYRLVGWLVVRQLALTHLGRVLWKQAKYHLSVFDIVITIFGLARSCTEYTDKQANRSCRRERRRTTQLPRVLLFTSPTISMPR
jgi:hypothetical protein